MRNISNLNQIDPSATGCIVRVEGVLLGGREFYITDSIENYDQGISLPIIDEDLFEKLHAHNIHGVAGGRFGFSHHAVIEAVLVPDARSFKFALTDIVSLVVKYHGRDVSII
jgi:hypothetical protein